MSSRTARLADRVYRAEREYYRSQAERFLLLDLRALGIELGVDDVEPFSAEERAELDAYYRYTDRNRHRWSPLTPREFTDLCERLQEVADEYQRGEL